MIFLKILEDERLKDSLDKVLSGTVDHSKFLPKEFTVLMSKINEVILPSELDGEYYVFLSSLTKINNIVKETESYEPHVTRDLFISIVQSNSSSLILNEDINIKTILEEEGLNTELNTPESRQIAAKCLLDRCIDLYDKLFEMEIDTLSSMQYISAFLESLKRHCATNSLYAQSKIISEGLFFNRKIYKGYEGWVEFTTVTTSELTSRINNIGSNQVVNINSVSKAMDILGELSKFNRPIASYGLPELDNSTSICARTLVVVVAKEGTGKTKFMTYTIARMLLENRKVLVIHGETHQPVSYASILSSYIFMKHKVVVGLPETIKIVDAIKSGDYSTLETPEKILKLFTTTVKDLADKDLLKFKSRLNYEKAYDELVDLYNINSYEGLFIDHSCDMDGGFGDDKKNVEALSKAVKRFRDKYDTYVQVLSQPSATCYESLAKGKRIEDSPTRASKMLSHDADEIYVLWDKPKLREECTICMDNYKLRRGGKINRLLKFRTKFAVSLFVSDPTLSGNEDKTGSVDETLDEIDNIFGSSLTNDEDDFNGVY